jgi:hypothetical protein
MSYTDPSRVAVAITPSDSTDIANGQLTRGVYVGGAGDVAAVIGDNAITFVGAVAGSILPIRCSRINSTSTTATSLVALF